MMHIYTAILFGLLISTIAIAAEPTHRDLEYASVGEHKLLLDIYEPSSVNEMARPLVVWIHGGAWRSGSKKGVPVTHWLEHGFAIASVDYRLSPEAKFPAQIHNIKASIRFLRANAQRFHIDPNCIIMAGASAGGHLAALVGVSDGVQELEGALGAHTTTSSRVQAIVSFYGASNLQSILSQSTEYGLGVRVPALQLFLGGQPQDKPDLAKLASPVAHIDAKDPPLWLIHGDADPQMPFEQSREFVDAYQRAACPVQLDVVKGGKHGGDEFFTEQRLKDLASQLRRDICLNQMLVQQVASAADFGYFLTGNATDAKPSHTEGALMLMGGGGLVDDAFRWFVQKAGGGDIVVLKATDDDAAVPDTYGAYLHETIGGCDSVEVIVCKNRNASSHAQVLQSIKNADGIFLAGGKQYLYVDYWKGTPVGEAIDAHVRAGRPLGGSSAGLAVLGQFCYTAHLTARLTSEIAMKDPFDKSLTFDNDFLHLELMRGVITDTHFSPRGRLGRLITFVARMRADNKQVQTIGIGVDEKTALCVEPGGSGRVLSTAPEGRAWFVLPNDAAAVLRAGEPLTYRDIKIIGAGPDSTVDILTRTIKKPASESSVSVILGKITTPDR